MSLTILPEVRKSISSVNDKTVISEFSYSILSNILLKYILNKIKDTEES